MNASKILTSAIASATIIGAVGFAYAQTSSSADAPAGGMPKSEAAQSQSTVPPASTMPSQDPMAKKPADPMRSAPASTDTTSPPAVTTTTTPTPTTSSDMPAPERDAKADRN